MNEGEILKNFIERQSKSKKQITEELGMARTIIYRLFSFETLEDDIKERFEQYFNAKIFTEENLLMGEKQSNSQVRHSYVKKQMSNDDGDYREKYIKQLEENNKILKEFNKELKISNTYQQRLLGLLEHKLKQLKNSDKNNES